VERRRKVKKLDRFLIIAIVCAIIVVVDTLFFIYKLSHTVEEIWEGKKDGASNNRTNSSRP